MNLSDNGVPYCLTDREMHECQSIKSLPLEIVPLDVEVYGNLEKSMGFPATPWYGRNSLAMVGIGATTYPVYRPAASAGGGYSYLAPKYEMDAARKAVRDLMKPPQYRVVAGHNIVFDLHWARILDPELDLKNVVLWDTQVAAYILSSHRMRQCSLEEASDVWLVDIAPALRKKLDGPALKAIKEGGLETVSTEDLASYLKKDLDITYGVATRQIRHAIYTKQFDLIVAMCEYLKVVEDMEWNGLHVNRNTLTANQMTISVVRAVADTEVTCYMRDVLNDFCMGAMAAPLEVKAVVARGMTPQVLSAVLFGGDLAIQITEQTGFYKTGARAGHAKTRKVTKTVTLGASMVTPPQHFGSELLKTGWWRVDEDVLRSVDEGLIGPLDMRKRLVGAIMRHRECEKYLETYCDGIANGLEISGTGVLHHRINTTNTRNGRTSSSEPNLQNVPTEVDDPACLFASHPIKRMFTSRYINGMLVEVDWKQLEVIGLAAITRDPNLESDLITGRDIHKETGKLVFGETHVMSTEERRTVKTVNFGLIYGGGKETLAKQAKAPLALVDTIIKAFYTRYNTIREKYKTDIIPDCDYIRDTKDFRWRSSTGRSYSIMSVPSNFPGGGTSVIQPAYTKIRNYPVSGLATGDFVPVVATALWHNIKDLNGLMDDISEPVLFTNMVHDSMLFDVPETAYYAFIETLANVLGNAGAIFKGTLGSDVFDGLPLRFTVSTGPNWNDMEEIDLKL